MKKFTEEYTDQRAWYASKWGEHTLPGQTKTKEGVRVRMPTNMAAFGREEGVFSKAEEVPEDYGFDEDTRPIPSDWREHILREIREHETREAWSKNVHAPAFGQELAENQEYVGNLVRTFRWHKGKAQSRLDNASWCSWRFGLHGEGTGDAWFRKHCPPDRFVTDAGEVLEFRMRDDGEAEAVDDEGTVLGESSGYPKDDATMRQRRGHYQALKALDRLIAFRDEERAKWTHKWEPGHSDDGWFIVHKDIRTCDFVYPHPNRSTWSEKALARVPLWKRREVEALYREKNPEWRVEWCGDGGYVRVQRGYEWIMSLDHEGLSYVNEEPFDVPDHIIARARAKFRENYKLRRNEIWFQGMPVTMVFEEGTNVPDRVVTSNGECDWLSESHEASRNVWHTVGVTFTDESERLEAYDRMRRYFYEEHPGKCLDRDGLRVLTFRMRGDEGHAEDVDGVAVYISGFGASATGDEAKKRAKLKAWTDAQIAKRVVFEGKVTSQRHNEVHILAPDDTWRNVETGNRYRVTLEPMGDA